MRFNPLMLALMLMVLAPPAATQGPSGPAPAESVQPHSMVSVMVDPALNDGRLVVRLAAQNRGTAPTPFGPSSVAIKTAAGEPIALVPLAQLVDDVRIAAGQPVDSVPVTSQAGGQSNRVLESNTGGQTDVSTYTGGMAVAGSEVTRRQASPKKVKPTISKEEADRQAAALKSAILQDTILQPTQIAAGQLVSAPLPFKKGDDRTIHLWVRIAGDEHGFTLLAPSK